MADPKLLDRLVQADVGQWPSILNTGASTQVSQWGEDTNWPLLRSAVTAAHQADENAAFIVLTGDLFPHHFREQLAGALTSPLDDVAFRSFAHKTFDFVLAQVQKIAPGKPVFYVLGNNDEYCDDYAVEPSGPFLADTAPSVITRLRTRDTMSLESGWKESGHYDVSHPTTDRIRILGLNSVFLSSRYQNRCGNTERQSPGEQELGWLEQHLQAARSRNQKAWIITHIPPGLDGFATEREWRNGNEHTFIPLWRPNLESRFAGLLAQYQSTAAVLLAAHIHSDTFRLVDGTLSLLTPSLSPNIRQDSAFRVVSLDDAGNLLDQKTWTLNNRSAASTRNDLGPTWQPEYDFNETWGIERLDPPNLKRLWSSIELNKPKQIQWMRLYIGAGTRPGPPPSVSWAQFCASGYADLSDFAACVHRHIP